MALKLTPAETALLKINGSDDWVSVHVEMNPPNSKWKSPLARALRRRGIEVRMAHYKHGVSETFARWPKGDDHVQN